MDALAAASLAAWICLALFRGKFWHIRELHAASPALPREAGAARVAVIIPARNEAATIGRAVVSLVGQDWPGQLDIWVVDDDSSDGTAEAAQKAGGERVSVCKAPLLPAGWTGKVWAMSCGVEAAQAAAPDYYLLTDADIEHSSDNLRNLVACAETTQLDLASIMVKLNCTSAAERLLVPAFVFFFFMLYPPRWIASKRRALAGAAGGCILIRSGALRRIGGLASIRGELIDDCALARRVKNTGGSIWLGLSQHTRSIREYPGFADIHRMISRTAFTQLRYSWLLLIGTLLGLLLLYVVPVFAALRGSVWGAAAWLLQAMLYAPMLRFYRRPVLSAVLLPFVGVYYAAATVESAWRHAGGRGGAWKGRHQAPSAT